MLSYASIHSFHFHLNKPYPILPKTPSPCTPCTFDPPSWYCLLATQFIQPPLPVIFLLCCQNLLVQGTCSTSVFPIPIPRTLIQPEEHSYLIVMALLCRLRLAVAANSL